MTLIHLSAAESFGRVGTQLNPPMLEVSKLGGLQATVLKFVFPFVYNIMVINFVISVLIAAFNAVREVTKQEMQEVCTPFVTPFQCSASV